MNGFGDVCRGYIQMVNFKEIIKIDVKHQLNELNEHPELWNEHRHGANNDVMDDILLRFNTESNNDPLESVSYPPWFVLDMNAHLARTLTYMLKSDRIGRVIIVKSKKPVLLNYDDDAVLMDYYNRCYVALTDAAIACNEETHEIEQGTVFRLNPYNTNQLQSQSTLLVVDVHKVTMRPFMVPSH